MQLTVKYSYVESIIPPRCRNLRRVRFDDGLEVVTLREITREAAPVAIISASDSSEPPIEYRWFDGHLWTSCSVYGCSRQAHTSGGTDYDYPAPGPELSLVTDSVSMSRHDIGIFVSVSEGKLAIAEYLQRWAQSLIFIDGQVYRPAGEPRYVVMTFGLSNNHGGTAVLCTDISNTNIKEQSYFSILQLEQAKDYADRIAAARGDTTKFNADPGYTFEVLIPEAVQIRNDYKQEDAA
ncbi:hypothetical protein LCG56_28940 (plasmid) [Pseudomonas cannabina pv. alisalensis]|uniref:Uncharacterized protein n=1 Tax=Pseudomonas syringae pv. maculicola str. ES4326 TaxID=629265 RepID=A0A8T8CA26_PSEYM|nr:MULTISPECIES: hypothetical protein [Pseudomonas syringae group]QHF00420.1 hypothetical protein PMA4326_028285 [Pseudomonas syringae pv. maculicola str. ES4326]UBZ00396.1 hypothetical protein LCG56_28940 [Pseudomonas cannabina pv. alisalensis]